MCRTGKTLKLCSCADEADIGWPRWELWRSSEGDAGSSLSVVGIIMPPPMDHVLLVERLEDDLNKPGTFDFDVEARDGDSLILKFAPEREYVFELSDGAWSERLWGAQEPETIETGPVSQGAIRSA